MLTFKGIIFPVIDISKESPSFLNDKQTTIEAVNFVCTG